MSILFVGSYQNETEPYWARAGQGGSGGVGPDLQVSTLVTNAEGFIALQAAGTIAAIDSGSIAFERTSDAGGLPTLVSIAANVPNGGGPPTENVSILNNTKTFYDPLSVGVLNVYGDNGVGNVAGSVGVIGQFGTSTDMQITTSGLHVSSIFVSTVNGGAYPPGDLGPNPSFSTVTINQQGEVILRATGDIDNLSTSKITFEKTTDFATAPTQLQMIKNINGNVAGGGALEYVAVTTPFEGNTYYDLFATGGLTVYPFNAPSTDPNGQVAIIQQYSTTTDVECLTTGFHTSNLIVSSINGVSPGGGGSSGPDILVSTVTVNSEGKITMTASGTSNAPVTAQIEFATTSDILGTYKPTNLAMEATNIINSIGVPFVSEQVAFTGRSFNPFVPQTVYRSLAIGNLLVYGTTNPVASTIGQLASFEEWQVGSTDVSCRTTGFHTSNIIASTIVCDNLTTTQPFFVSTINTDNLITSTMKAPFINASTLSYAPTYSAGGVDLGLGDFLGSAFGQFASDVYTQSIAGAALATGVVGLIVPRTTNNIYPPGEVSSFQTVNLQTQLQYSTIGSQVSSFYRFVSSTDGLNGTVTPGKEYIVSSIIAPGTVCIRSFSDPINLTNASTFTSTVQSFGYWVPVPQQATLPFSTVTGDFVVRSTLTAYKENISTTLNVQGLVTAGSIASQGAITAATNIVATGTVQAGVNVVAAQNLQAINAIITGNITTVGLGVSGNATITGAVNANIGYIQTNVNVIAPNINTSSITLSTINGLPYNPGGPNASGIFSTLLVSSMTTTSSLNVIGTTNTSTLNAQRVTTNAVTANTVTATSMQFGSGLGNITALNNAGGIYNPINGLITFASGVYSTLTTSTITTRSINANTISTQELLISTVNGLTYPPPFNSTIIGDLIVTSTLKAQEVFAYGDITTPGNIGASGNITGVIGTFTSIADAGALSVGGGANITGLTNITGDLRASGSGVIGGVGLGPVVAGRNSGDIYGRGAYVSSITTNGDSIFNGSLNVNAPGAIFTNQLQLQNGGIFGVSSINNVAYPPFIPTQSTFNQIYTSSIQTSTMTALGSVTAHGIVNLGNISTTSINLPGIDIGVTTGQISSVTMKSLSLDTINLRAVAGGMSSLTISTINGIAYPPSAGANSVFSTIVVSSIATVGSISAGGGNVGGVTFPGGGVASGAILTGTTVNGTTVNGTNVNATTLNSGNVNNTGAIQTPTLNIPQSGNINLAYLAKINGADTNQIELGTGFETYTSSITTITPGIMSVRGAYTPTDVRGLSSIITLDATDDYGTLSMYGYKLSTSVGVLCDTIITPGSIILGTLVGRSDITFQTGGSGTVQGNWTVVGSVVANNANLNTLSVSSISATQVGALNGSTANAMNQIGGQTNTGIQKTSPNPPPPIGIAQLITGSIYQTGQYNYGTFVFNVNTPIPMSNTYFCCRYPCAVKVVLQSFANGGSLGTQNAQTMNGIWEVYFGQSSALTVGGPYQDLIQVTPVYQNNCYMSNVAVPGYSNTYYLAPATTINDGRPPTQVTMSWMVQPVFISP